MRVRIAIYLLALLFVTLPSRPWASASLPPTLGPALRIEPEPQGLPVLRTTLALVLITGLGVEIAIRRRAR